MRLISILSIVLVGVLTTSCTCKFHVCIETESKSLCDECKKKPIYSYRPQDQRPEKPISIKDIPFTRIA
jgi:hypothetical protein